MKYTIEASEDRNNWKKQAIFNHGETTKYGVMDISLAAVVTMHFSVKHKEKFKYTRLITEI